MAKQRLKDVITESETLLPKATPEQEEWDKKAIEFFKSIEDKNPTKDELRRRILSKLGPRPETRSIAESPGTILILKKLNTRQGWHKLKCAKTTMLRIYAMEYAEVMRRPSKWYEMKITAKGRKFLRDLKLSEEE